MTPYLDLVRRTAQIREDGRALALGGYPDCPRVEIPADAPRVLLFAPHPDDECIVGGLALRLLRDARWRVINVAVTQGSNPDRQEARLEELRAACRFLQFDLVLTAPRGLEKIQAKTRTANPAHWEAAVRTVAGILAEQAPRVVFLPHELDWNSTHIGTHLLVVDALRSLLATFSCFTVETEFWGPMSDPNLMVENSEAEVADLMAACSFHVGEVQRNPYHLNQTSWMQDNVRRGGELVGGQGRAAPDFLFATLYRLRKWGGGEWNRTYEGGRNLPSGQDPTSLFR